MRCTLTEPRILLDVIQELAPDSSKRTLRTWLKVGRVQVDGRIVTVAKTELEAGQTVEIGHAPRREGVRIYFQDRYLVVAEKPSGLLTVPTDSPDSPPSLWGRLAKALKTEHLYPVHRLDREASGVIMFARGKESRDKIKKMFENRELTREYYAILEGSLPNDAGTWESYLMELPNLSVVSTTDQVQGRRAVTHYSVIRRTAKFTHLKLKLESGRKHQIRVHCKEAGYTILGDKRYGDRRSTNRLCLHAERLAFIHPFTKKKLDFSSNLPMIFKKLGAEKTGE